MNKQATLLVVLAVIFFIGGALAIQADDDSSPAISVNLIRKIRGTQSQWKAGINKKFVGKTIAEVKKLLGLRGFKPTIRYSEDEQALIEQYYLARGASALPDSFDSRNQWPGCIHPIRNQEQCGSCWAFSSSEVLSDRFCIASKGAVNVVLSPQDLVSCNWYNNGCSGGILPLAWLYLERTGIVPDSCMPYTSGNGVAPSCPKNCNGTSVSVDSEKYRVSSFYEVGSIVGFFIKEEKIMKEIMTNGPVQTGFSVYQDFINYKSGVYQHTTGSFLGGHAVKIVGWGVENGVKYWIVANSWDVTWGLNGFFWIKRGSDECGIEGDVYTGIPDLGSVPKQ